MSGALLWVVVEELVPLNAMALLPLQGQLNMHAGIFIYQMTYDVVLKTDNRVR